MTFGLEREVEVDVASEMIISISDVFRYSSPAMFCKHWSPS